MTRPRPARGPPVVHDAAHQFVGDLAARDTTTGVDDHVLQGHEPGQMHLQPVVAEVQGFAHLAPGEPHVGAVDAPGGGDGGDVSIERPEQVPEATVGPRLLAPAYAASATVGLWSPSGGRCPASRSFRRSVVLDTPSAFEIALQP